MAGGVVNNRGSVAPVTLSKLIRLINQWQTVFIRLSANCSVFNIKGELGFLNNLCAVTADIENQIICNYKFDYLYKVHIYKLNLINESIILSITKHIGLFLLR